MVRSFSVAVVALTIALGLATPPARAEGGDDLAGALARGTAEEVEALLAKGADVNRADGEGHTPLMWAVGKNDVALVKVLLRYGADVHRRTRYGRSALDMAKAYNNPEIQRLLGEQARPTPAAPEPRLASSLAVVQRVAAGQIDYVDATGAAHTAALPAPKDPWLAGGTSLLAPGLGEILNGDHLLGGSLLAANVAAFLLQAYAGPGTQALFAATRVAVNAGSVAGAAWRAEQLNRDRQAMLSIGAGAVPTREQQELLDRYRP